MCVCAAKPKQCAVARDSIALGMSPFSDRASCCIHFTWGSLETLPELPPLLEALENVLRPFNPRPHYGKLVFSSFKSHSLAQSLPADSLDQWVTCWWLKNDRRLEMSCLNYVFRFTAIVDMHDPTGPFFSIYLHQAYCHSAHTHNESAGQKFQNQWVKQMLK